MNLERNFFASKFLHCFFEQPYVGVISDRFDMAVLFSAEQVSRPAQFEIESGDFEASA